MFTLTNEWLNSYFFTVICCTLLFVLLHNLSLAWRWSVGYSQGYYLSLAVVGGILEVASRFLFNHGRLIRRQGRNFAYVAISCFIASSVLWLWSLANFKVEALSVWHVVALAACSCVLWHYSKPDLPQYGWWYMFRHEKPFEVKYYMGYEAEIKDYLIVSFCTIAVVIFIILGLLLYKYVALESGVREARDFMLGNSGVNLLVAACVMIMCWFWSDGLDDGEGGVKTRFGVSYFPNSGWRSKTVKWFGNTVFLVCLLLVVYRVAFIRAEEVHVVIKEYPVTFVFQESETVRCGRRWCTQIRYRARTNVDERSVLSGFVTSGNKCNLTDYESYVVLKDKFTGEVVNASNHKTYTRLTISKECMR